MRLDDRPRGRRPYHPGLEVQCRGTGWLERRMDPAPWRCEGPQSPRTAAPPAGIEIPGRDGSRHCPARCAWLLAAPEWPAPGARYRGIGSRGSVVRKPALNRLARRVDAYG